MTTLELLLNMTCIDSNLPTLNFQHQQNSLFETFHKFLSQQLEPLYPLSSIDLYIYFYFQKSLQANFPVKKILL